MKNKKSFTLIEIIISIALLGIISIVILYCIVSQYSLIVNTRELTQDVYESQKRIEDIIEDVKKAVQSGTPPTDSTSYKLFAGKDYERTVYGFPRETEVSLGNNTRTLFTVIADNRMPEFAVASASISINFSNGSTIPYAYKDTPSLYVNSNVTLVDPNNVNLTNIYRWYVSRPGFNIPIINSPLEIEMGTKYPIFPDDYTIIPGVSATNLTSILASYAGRHLICTVTPASQSGKMGVTAISKPIFLSGLPVIGNLKLHLDASMISKEDGNQVNSETVIKWNDISNNGNTINQTTINKQPKLIEEKIGNLVYNGLQYETYAKFVRFDGTNDGMLGSIASLDVNNMTVFVVARSGGASNFSIYRGNDAASFLSIKRNYSNGSISIGYDGGTSYKAVDIAEILVYNSSTIPQSDIDLINNYLKNKYHTVVPAVTGVTLDQHSVAINIGSTKTLTAAIIPSNAGSNDFTWSSSNPAVATVSDTGIVTGITQGTAVITVTAEEGNVKYTDSCTVSVVTKPVAKNITGDRDHIILAFDNDIKIKSAEIVISDDIDISGLNSSTVSFYNIYDYFPNNTNITINVTSTDGGSSTIIVKRISNQLGATWSIVSQ